MKVFYAIVCSIVRVFIWPLFPMGFRGRENIPEGAAIVCANHSSYLDPVLASFAFTARRNLRFMSKAELFRIPILGPIIRGVGAFPVSRGTSDVNAIRYSMQYLKQGEKILMFPEGTRVSEDDALAVKTGAVRLALKLNVPVVPMYIPRSKHIFKRDYVIIGKPYYPEKTDGAADYQELSDELLYKIESLVPKNETGRIK